MNWLSYIGFFVVIASFAYIVWQLIMKFIGKLKHNNSHKGFKKIGISLIFLIIGFALVSTYKETKADIAADKKEARIESSKKASEKEASKNARSKRKVKAEEEKHANSVSESKAKAKSASKDESSKKVKAKKESKAKIASEKRAKDKKASRAESKAKKESSSTNSSSKSKKNVPTEYASALNKAEEYATTMDLSEQGLHDQLTSNSGEGFSEAAAQYALNNLKDVNWNKNALDKAEDYANSMDMSKQGIIDQLSSSSGEQFTASQAQYAVNHLTDVNWNENALNKAKDYQDMDMSKSDIREQLSSSSGEQFTPEQAQYAVNHLK